MIDNTTYEENGTSDGYSFSKTNYNAGKSGLGHNLTSDIPQGDVRYDTATGNMEYPWKMATQVQFEELINNKIGSSHIEARANFVIPSVFPEEWSRFWRLSEPLHPLDRG